MKSEWDRLPPELQHEVYRHCWMLQMAPVRRHIVCLEALQEARFRTFLHQSKQLKFCDVNSHHFMPLVELWDLYREDCCSPADHYMLSFGAVLRMLEDAGCVYSAHAMQFVWWNSSVSTMNVYGLRHASYEMLSLE